MGADSTTTTFNPDGSPHFYNHAQKLFEIGDGSTLAAVTWGLGGLDVGSYRRLFARLADEFEHAPPTSVEDAALRWIDLLWNDYTNSTIVSWTQALAARPAHGTGQPNERSGDEEKAFNNLRQNAVVGFCLAGYVRADRQPSAQIVIFDPLQPKPVPTALPTGNFAFWGAPNIVKRLMWGCGDDVKAAILGSPAWGGTEADLDALIRGCFVGPPAQLVPIRDAIDFVNYGIVSTIKAFKFSNFSQICGGPVEIAVVTADRSFRWVRHKDWDSAIHDGAA